MSAKTVIERATSASLNIIFEDWYTGATLAYKTICSSAHVEHGNALVDIYVTTNDTGSEVEVWADITVTAGTNTDTDNVLLAILDKSSFPYRPSTNNLPVSIPVTFELTGLFLRTQHTETPVRSDGGVTHPSECTLTEEWSWEEGATQTVTCGAATATCDVSEEAGVVDLFDDFFDVVVYGSATCVEAGDAVTFDSITCGDVAVRADQCDQDSNATYDAGRGWTGNDGGDYTAAGTGSSITLSGNTTSAANAWYGWVKQPFAINFASLGIRKFLGDDWPEAVVHVVGLTDPDGATFCDTVAVLRALGTIVTPDCYSWIAEDAYEVPPYVAWTGWKPGATIRVYLDETWLRGQVEHQANEDYNDTWIILDGWPLDATNRTAAPHFRSVFEMAHVSSVNVNDPPTTTARPTAFRPSSWVGSAGVTVDPADNDSWTIALGATAPTVSRDLATIFWQRLAAIKTATAGSYLASGLPEGYLYDKANQDENYPEPADGKTRDDVTGWARYRFLKVGLDIPVACTLTLRVEWDEVSIQDSHVTGSQRLEDLIYTALPRAAEYTLEFASTGSQSITLDLLAEAEQFEAAKMHQVRRLVFSGFPVDAEREFVLETLELRQHATHSFRFCKRVDQWTYSEVGFSMVVDGALASLALPDNFHENVEDGLGVIRWSIGAETGLDLSGAMYLPDLVNILNNLEGLTCTWDATDWDTHTLDVDEVRLCNALPWHLIEAEARDEADPGVDDWDWHLAIRVLQITIVRGLVYNFCADKILEMGLHGVAWSGGALAPSATVYVWKRPADGGAWVLVGSCTSDDLGYFWMGELPVLETQGTTYEDDVKWEYGISATESNNDVESLGCGHQREWIQRSAILLVSYHPSAVNDRQFAVVTLAYQRYGGTMTWRQWDPRFGWSASATIPYAGDRPALTRYHMGSVNDLLYLTDTDEVRSPQQEYQRNEWARDGALLQGTQFAAATGPTGIGVCYLDSGSFYFRLYRREGTGTTREALSAAVSLCAGEDQPPSVSRSHETWSWYVAVPTSAGVVLYKSDTGSDGSYAPTFTALRTFTDLTYPSVVCVPWGVLVAGVEAVVGGFQAVLYTVHLGTGEDLRAKVTAVNSVLEDRLALVNVAPVGKLKLLASGPSTDPGLLVYGSGNYGQTWAKETVLG